MNNIKRTLGFIFDHPLSRRHPARALMRLLWWQLQCRLMPGRLIPKPFIHAVKIYARKGLTGVTGNLYSGLHEFFDMGFLLHFLRPEDVFFDVGANAGSYSLLASGICRSSSISLEPAPATFEILGKNIRLNQLSERVTLINAAAGAEPGVLKFSTAEDTTNHVLSANEVSVEAVNVPVITLDSLLSPAPPALIKIDVEGFETPVLEGMSRTMDLPSLKAIIIELNGSGTRYGFNEQAIHTLLKSKGFQPYHYDPFKRELIILETFGSHNTIYCRDLPFIKERLMTATSFSVFRELI